MRLFIIINPHASCIANLTAEGLAAQVRGILDAWPHRPDYELLIPESPEHLREALERALSGGQADRVVVAGGDGTIQEALPVMLKYPDVTMGLIPLGTGNLLAFNLGIPHDLPSALRTALEGHVQSVDLGRINGVTFVLNASIGIDAEIMKQTDREIKRRLGKLAYYVTGLSILPGFRHVRMRLEADGHVIHTRAVGVNVATARMRVPGGITLSPDGTVDDNLLHGTIFKMRRLLDYFAFFIGALLPFRRPSRMAETFAARRIHIRTWPPLVAQADGNVIGETPAVIEIIPEKLRFCVPRPVGPTG